MTPAKALVALAASAAILAGPAHAGLTGYMKLPDIDGESKRASGHEDEIDIHDVVWKVNASGAGMMEISLAGDALERASRAGFGAGEDVVIRNADKNAEIVEAQCVGAFISGYSAGTRGAVAATLSCSKINILYTVQADDHGA
jgi:type VI secretion system secreted protein Hcp